MLVTGILIVQTGYMESQNSMGSLPSKGTKSAEEAGLHACTSDIDLLFEHRLTRFRTK